MRRATEEIPNLGQFQGELFLDLDDTLVPTSASLDLLYMQAVESHDLDFETLQAERTQQRQDCRASVSNSEVSLVPPYDVYGHFSRHGIEADQVDQMGTVIIDRHPNLLTPGASEFLSRLGEISLTPTILTYGHGATQHLKVRISGLSQYPVVVLDIAKGVYLSRFPEQRRILVDDRPRYLDYLPQGTTGVLFDPMGKHPSFSGPTIQRFDQLWGINK